MIAVVIKSFSTPLHRFAVKQVVDESDVDGPLDIMALIDRGFLLPGTVMPEPESPPAEESKGE